MLSRELLRERPQEVRELLATRGTDPELFGTWEVLDKERRELIGQLRDRWLSGDLDALVTRTRDLAQQLRTLDQQPRD